MNKAKWLAIILPLAAAIAFAPYLLSERWNDYRSAANIRSQTDEQDETLRAQGKIVPASEAKVLNDAVKGVLVRTKPYLQNLGSRYEFSLSELTPVGEDVEKPISTSFTPYAFQVSFVGPVTRKQEMLQALLGSEIRTDPLFDKMLILPTTDPVFTTVTDVSQRDNGAGTVRFDVELIAWSNNAG